MVVLGIWLAVIGYAIAYSGLQSLRGTPTSFAQAIGLPQATPASSPYPSTAPSAGNQPPTPSGATPMARTGVPAGLSVA